MSATANAANASYAHHVECTIQYAYVCDDFNTEEDFSNWFKNGRYSFTYIHHPAEKVFNFKYKTEFRKKKTGCQRGVSLVHIEFDTNLDFKDIIPLLYDMEYNDPKGTYPDGKLPDGTYNDECPIDSIYGEINDDSIFIDGEIVSLDECLALL